MYEDRDLELAWAGGLFDGEGCISNTKFSPTSTNRTVRFRMWVALAMCDEASVRRFAGIIGIGHVYARKQKSWKSVHWEWRAGDVMGEKVIRMMRPYLFTKKAQADEALRYRELCAMQQDGRNRRIHLTDTMLEERAHFHALLRDMKKTVKEVPHL